MCFLEYLYNRISVLCVKKIKNVEFPRSKTEEYSEHSPPFLTGF